MILIELRLQKWKADRSNDEDIGLICLYHLPGESIRTPDTAFEKILIPEYPSNDVENCRVLSPICQIRFSNLPGFNWSFLPVEIGDFLQKAPFENLQRRAKTASKISLCSPS